MNADLCVQELEEADREWMEHTLKKSWLDAEYGQKWLNIEVATDGFQTAILLSWNETMARWGTKPKSKCRRGKEGQEAKKPRRQ